MTTKSTARHASRRPDVTEMRPGIDYWRVERVAHYLDISRKRVYQLVQEKKLDVIRLGPRQMRITKESLDIYIKLLMEKESENWEWSEMNP